MPARKSPPRKRPPRKAGAPLDRYRQKRDFQRSPEPKARKSRAAGRSFVVQEHHARSHHYDLRLEMDGVLTSWAVPKGIPEEPAAKRLAVHVEDHPLEYGSFEGVIPKGQYGAGTVAIWDHGEWQPLDRDWHQAFAHGKLKFALKGRRLDGVYLLVRMHEEPNWLMRKLDEEPPVEAAPSLAEETAHFVAPQLARVVATVPAGHEWRHEIKFDGYRLIVVKHGRKLQIFTRNGLDWTDRFRLLAKRLVDLSDKDYVLDGEAVVLDSHGRSRFGELQAALQAGAAERIRLVVFDLLHFDGRSLRELPWSQRVERLAGLVSDEPGPVSRSKVWPAAMGKELFQQACKNGLEGIVSKKASGSYREGSRRDWVKSKCRARQEFVVCGYTPPKGSLKGFGALVLASYEHGKLVARGKVGTGFSDRQRLEWLAMLQRLPPGKPPFSNQERQVVWVEPRLVVEVEFHELTRDGSIRQGSFVALREDKAASEVELDPVQVAAPDAQSTQAAGLVISHPERMVYPADQITKLEVARYYERVGEWMLPFVSNRPLALLRAPDGISGQVFFQKSFAEHLPAHVQQTTLDDSTEVISIKDVRGLVSLAQFGAVEFHPWGARLPTAAKPDYLVWDLDPDAAVAWNEVLGAALLVRDYLTGIGLSSVVKTSGGKGLHIMVMLKPSHEWEVMRDFTKAVAQAVAALNPQRFVITSSKARRRGKIFIDWMRNTRGATCIAPWGLRARPGAAVSMPINWGELRDVTADGFTLREPPRLPEEWLHVKPQTIPRAVLRKSSGGS